MTHDVFSSASFAESSTVIEADLDPVARDDSYHRNLGILLAENSSTSHNMFVRNKKTNVRKEENDMTIITATQLKNGLGRFLEEAKNGEVLVVTKDGREICEIRPRTESKLAIFDSLTGIASHVDASSIRDERTSKL